MKTSFEKITPKIAAEYLSTNSKSNRKIRQGYVDFLATEMVSGRWISESAESIKFNRQGVLIDGQHRLSALIKANKTLYFLVARNLHEQTFKVIDTGISRSGADVFMIEGIKNANSMAAGVKVFYVLENTGSTDPTRTSRISNSVILNMYKDSPDYWHMWHSKSMKWYNDFSHLISNSIILGFAVFLDKNSRHRSKIDDFFNQLCMDGMTQDKSIKLLRKKLIENKVKTEKLTHRYKFIYMIKTWNCFVQNKQINVLKFDPDKEESPTII